MRIFRDLGGFLVILGDLGDLWFNSKRSALIALALFEEVLLYAVCCTQCIENYMTSVYVLRHYVSEPTHKYAIHRMGRNPLTYILN